MELQQIFKCKTCEQSLDEFVALSSNGLVECPYCYNIWTIPKKETNPAALSFLRIGEHNLDTCKFDEAYTAFKKAAELDSSEPEAYFGMALAEFKVQYLKDISGEKPRLQPICHEISDKKFSDNPDYMRAYMKATDGQRKEYEKKAQEIDYALNEFYKLKQSGLDYDCFICVKVTDDDTKLRTPDYKDADDIYFSLRGSGYKPFFSERELGGATGADYEARILYALYTSECMVVVCHNAEYLNTPWVKNEYTRFLKLVNDEEKESDSITIAFRGKAVERLHGRSGKLQGIDLGKLGAMSKIEAFVESHTPEARKKREEAKNAKLREQEQQANRLKELEQQLAQMQNLVAGVERQNKYRIRKCPNCGGAVKIENGVAICTSCNSQYPAYEENSDDELFERMERARIERERKEKEERERIAREQAAKLKRIADEFTIEDGVLEVYKGIKSDVIIPDCVSSIGEGAFRNRTDLTSVTIPNSVTAIADLAFGGCTGLTSINIPNGLTSICKCAFRDCKNLTSIIIPESVTFIDSYAFYGCSGLTVYCRHQQKPYDWFSDWDVSKEGMLSKKRVNVVWGYKGN